MSRRVVRFRIKADLILEALLFPKGTRVLACYGERVGWPGEVEFVVEHADLPEVREGEDVPLIIPLLQHHQVEFNWNLDDDQEGQLIGPVWRPAVAQEVEGEG